jgi:tryptophanyl-tRNA synthetase
MNPSFSPVSFKPARVVSGMRPTGALHLGHDHGALKNWVALQHSHECLFFVADWHALTTHYENVERVQQHTIDMVIDWLACGLDPERCILFVQSRLPEHAELFTLLAMGTPLSWLERVPTYKDQQEKLADKNLATYGFLGYPLLQAADILIYQAQYVPVGEDQVCHVELTREVARRFNALYGRGPVFEALVEQVLKARTSDEVRRLEKARTRFQQTGDDGALEEAMQWLQTWADQATLSPSAHQALQGWLKGTGQVLLREPQALLTPAGKLPGLDGQKMSKSYGNTIAIREDPAQVEHKIKRMPTDPARVKRSDPGDPARCPVWSFHQVYSDAPTQAWVQEGCKGAQIGCLDCKKPVIEAILQEQIPRRERAQPYIDHPERVREILHEGSLKAAGLAQETMQTVRQAVGLSTLRP